MRLNQAVQLLKSQVKAGAVLPLCFALVVGQLVKDCSVIALETEECRSYWPPEPNLGVFPGQ